MGLITGAIDIVVVSTGCAAVRRVTNNRIHIASTIQSKIKSPTIKAASIAYFGLGETILSTVVLTANRWEADWKETQNKFKETEALAKRLREEREKEREKVLQEIKEAEEKKKEQQQ